jgi:hypothetical protein
MSPTDAAYCSARVIDDLLIGRAANRRGHGPTHRKH